MGKFTQQLNSVVLLDAMEKGRGGKKKGRGKGRHFNLYPKKKNALRHAQSETS